MGERYGAPVTGAIFRPTNPADAPLPGCTFGQAVRRFYGRYARFGGRSSRSEYWKVALPLSGISLFGQLAASGGIENAGLPTKIIIGVVLLIWLGSVVPFCALSVRRLHDVNFSGWWFLLVVVPFAAVVLFVLYCLPGHPEGDRFDRAAPTSDPAP